MTKLTHAGFRNFLQQRIDYYEMMQPNPIQEDLLEGANFLLDKFNQLPDIGAELEAYIRSQIETDAVCTYIPAHELLNKIKELQGDTKR